MTATDDETGGRGTGATKTGGPETGGARHAGFLADLRSVAGRAVREIPREPEAVIPAIIVPVFFFIVNIGALEKLAERGTGLDFKAFQLPVAIIFAVNTVVLFRMLSH